jgi:hypothetical protein
MARTALILSAALVAATLTLVTPGQAGKSGPAAGYVQQFLYHSVEVDPGKSGHILVKCPPGWIALDGGLESDPRMATLIKSVPETPATTWRFRVDLHSEQPEVVTFWVECLKPIPGFKPKAAKPRFVVTRVGRNKGLTVPIKCPKPLRPGGLADKYIELMPGGRKVSAAGTNDTAEIVSARPTARGHVVKLRGGSSDTRVALGQVCLPEEYPPAQRVRVPVEAPPGDFRVSADCGPGRTPVGMSGFAFGRSVGAAPGPARDGDMQLRVANDTDKKVSGAMFVSCAKGKLKRTRLTGVTVDTEGGELTIGQG